MNDARKMKYKNDDKIFLRCFNSEVCFIVEYLNDKLKIFESKPTYSKETFIQCKIKDMS